MNGMLPGQHMNEAFMVGVVVVVVVGIRRGTNIRSRKAK
jgi:hypothetical protein